ncbi:MAG: DEAD/DEAH box helicase family protein [Gammaproteobacteria bacterium]
MPEQIPFAGRTIGDILADIHAAPHAQAIGAEFERLFRYAALRLSGLDVKNIWRWAEWPEREEHCPVLDGMDYGVDAVAELHDGSLVAVQCKCYAEDHKVQRADVQKFIAGVLPGAFDLRWIVAVNEYTGNAEKLIAAHGIRIIDFREYLKEKLTDEKQPLRQPWPLQQEAIDAVLRGFAESGRDRGRLIMACGTGKTFTALRIAEQLAPHENAAILFIAPSIALVAQARREWLRHTARPLACTVICSDSSADKDSEEDISHTEISCLVTTDPAKIAKRLARPAAGAHAVFCTYQSLKKLRNAQHKHGAPEFDLAVVDEAHRTTGYLDGERAGLFQLIHKQDEIRAGKRLYMTATPRVYEIRESKREEDRARIVDMNDDETYGREFYRLSFSKAVAARMLCDYRVIALGISEAAMTDALSRRLLNLNVEGAGRAADEQSILALGAIALAVNGAVRGENQPGVLARTIAYASNIRRSKWLARALRDDDVKSWIRGGGDDALPINAEHLDGTSSALNRNKALRDLNRDSSVDAPRLISNAQLFTEGVDVPALNAIAFLDPKQSKVETIQAVGRVMRRDDASEKQFGYIVVPVILPPNAELLQILEEDRARFRSLGNVLSALQSHDERLYTELTERLTFANINPDPDMSERIPPEEYQVQLSLLDENAKQEIFAQIAKNTGIANRGKIIADAITAAIEKAARLFANEGAAKIIAGIIGMPSDNEEESCKTAALLIANACIMHKRLGETGNLGGLTAIESANRVRHPSSALAAAWRTILAKDYAPIFHDATALLERLSENPRIESAISVLIQCAIDNATTLNEIGFDHAGPLYHKVLGSAQSDGAFYTKNLSAYLLAGLAFGDGFTDWSDAARVGALRIADPACGTGTLLMAALNIIKKRAAEAQQLDDDGKQKLHKQLVENVMHGFDINRYSVQLAACNLTIGAPQTDYARMNLHALKHGPMPGKDGANKKDVQHGALEWLPADNVLGIEQPLPPLYGENPVLPCNAISNRLPGNGIG